MGLFSKIARVFSQADANDEDTLQKELAVLNQDGRLHSRYVVHGEGVAVLKLDNGMVGMVKDISYGGMAVRFGNDGDEAVGNLPTALKGTFILLDQQMSCRLSPVRTVSQNGKVLFVGFSLHHESPDTLIFLRDFIEPLRCGRSFAQLSKEMRNDRYKGDEWNCFRGDGPTDLIVRSTADATGLEEALLTFRINETYCDVNFKNGQIKTARMVDRDGNSIVHSAAARMQVTNGVDRQVLRAAIYILMSSPTAVRKLTKPIMREGLKLLNLAYNESAA